MKILVVEETNLWWKLKDEEDGDGDDGGESRSGG